MYKVLKSTALAALLVASGQALAWTSNDPSFTDNCSWQVTRTHSAPGFYGVEYKAIGSCKYRNKFMNYRHQMIHYW
ncbi:hypothetical protein [Pseudoalteromonas luteoviolacea]|uniref:Secreted protein n=1 Tax=Pseudoalteromonas luteoviolacea H33 TaxID=1365251 RepID=A0A162AMG9_9GAMM|nr:hypothetical protein [Pseudoalteromonas luteoviolacea]KZN52457.1 hypothetical protein N476_10360 [Pseudoalteromonas luteoviolacea H33]KZN76611.1 hypothetical protein N477_15995 [Pseudoalteromonas luteoviolacea H33-S]MBQ4877106.1 hypothetical protein [Pseudoalteromonas luteoviolacea]MBQ4905967.1 hypothetical protein [Pseudoalteromonas luteoviolacea]